MKTYKDNQDYHACWNTFFPFTPMPNDDHTFIRSIVSAGRHLLRQYKVENYSYMPVHIGIRSSRFKKARIDLYNFSFHLKMLRDELHRTRAQIKHLNQLQDLIDKFNKAMQILDKIASSDRKLLQFLRMPFSIERQPAKAIKVYVPPEFPVMSIGLIYN